MKTSLKEKISNAIVLMVILVGLGCIAYNYLSYIQLNNAYTDSLATTIANTCRLVIDGDRVEGYLNTKCRDSEYYDVWNKLIDYRRTNSDIVELSVIDYSERGGRYVFDTDLTENGAFLGDLCVWDDKQIPYAGALQRCEEIGSIKFPTHTDYYTPIFSSYNIPVAYVVVGISTISGRKQEVTYFFKLVLIVASITAVCCYILLRYMKRNVINPINELSDAAENYAKSMEDEGQVSPIKKMEVKTGDELERLCESMKKMENDILSSSAELVLANWNSNHDVMTQMLNRKGYLDAIAKIDENDEDCAIIYMDIDNLKKTNDTLGHEMGDEMIKKAARFIEKYATQEAICCRLGGDEFVMLLPNMSSWVLDKVLQKMKSDPEEILSYGHMDFCVRLAIGGVCRVAGENMVDAVKRAEEEMYLNKHTVR